MLIIQQQQQGGAFVIIIELPLAHHYPPKPTVDINHGRKAGNRKPPSWHWVEFEAKSNS
jgi:hypothetical protein